MEEFDEMLLARFPDLDASDLVTVMAQATMAAHTGGRAVVENEAGD